MPRRWLGLLTVIVALTAVVVVDRIHPTLVSGIAGAGPVPAAPTVGDCVLEPFADGDGWSEPGEVYPPLRTGTCAGPRYGEVVAVVRDGLTNHSAAAQTAAGADVGAQDRNPLFRTCSSQVMVYVGMPAPQADSVPTLLRIWFPPGIPETTVIGPSLRQQAAGQRWLACSYRIPATRSVTTSLKDEFTTGVVPGVFARCRTSVNPAYPTYQPLACNVPHPVEEFGVQAEPATAADRETSCRQLVHQLTGMADPTVDGRLKIQVLVTPRVDNSADPVYCVLAAVGRGKLDGPLLGLGAAPVPWAN